MLFVSGLSDACVIARLVTLRSTPAAPLVASAALHVKMSCDARPFAYI